MRKFIIYKEVLTQKSCITPHELKGGRKELYNDIVSRYNSCSHRELFGSSATLTQKSNLDYLIANRLVLVGTVEYINFMTAPIVGSLALIGEKESTAYVVTSIFGTMKEDAINRFKERYI